MNQKINVDSAIQLLKSGGNLDQVIIADLNTSKVSMIDALLLAKNGFVVPDGNIVYDDEQIRYDPDFDEVTWGKPLPFKKLRQSLETEQPLPELTELVVKLHVKSADMTIWLTKNKTQINRIISGLLESMYEADKDPPGIRV